MKETLKKQKWLVLGAGVSGIEAARLLKVRKNNVTVCDKKALSETNNHTCQSCGIDFVLEKNVSLNGFDGLLLSPGIPLDHRFVLEAKNHGIKVDCEIDLGLRGYIGKIIGITGTNGKSTIVSMIHHIFNESGIKSCLAGNIGLPPSSLAADGLLEPIIVLELSSYQLEHSKGINADFGAFCSFSSDHLARHGSLEHYFRSKFKLFHPSILAEKTKTTSGLSSRQSSVVGLIDKTADQYGQSIGIKASDFGLETFHDRIWTEFGITAKSVLIEEEHNLANAYVAICACMATSQLTKDDCIKAIRTFKGLPHRLEVCGKIEGRKIINDSKATNINSVIVAIKAQKDPVCLFLGGQGKGDSFSDLLEYKNKILKIFAFGNAADQIERELGKEIRTEKHETLSELLTSLQNVVKLAKGDILFSPGCASFDEYSNFEARGNFFKKKIAEFLKLAEI